MPASTDAAPDTARTRVDSRVFELATATSDLLDGLTLDDAAGGGLPEDDDAPTLDEAVTIEAPIEWSEDPR